MPAGPASEPPLSGSGRGSPLPRWGLALVCLGFGATLLMKVGGADVWWHLRTGQWIAAHGEVPATDPFSHTAPGPWRYTDALSQLMYAGLHALGGIEALVVTSALLGAALALLVAWLAEGGAGARALAVGLVGAASHAAMALKPQIFSYLAFGALLLWVRGLERALDRPGERPRDSRFSLARPLRWMVPLPVGFALWGNLHRGGTLGLAVLGALLLAWALRPERRRLLAALAALTLACAAALTLNPGGTWYVTSALDLATRSSFSELLVDWQPLTPPLLLQHHWALIPLLTLALAGRRGRWRRIDVELLVLLGVAALAVRSVRFVPFVAIAAAPGASRAAQSTLAWLERRGRGRARRSVLQLAFVSLGVALLAARYTWQVPAAYRGIGLLEGRAPVGAAAFLREHPPPGRMFNDFGLGGYLLYALAPEQKVYVDGRNDTVYGDDFFRHALSLSSSPDAFAQAVERHQLGYAVVPYSGPGDRRYAYLHADPRWVLVYWDDAAAVLVRRSADSQSYVAEHGYEQLSLHDAYARVARLGAGPADRQLAREVQRQLARAPDSLSTLYLGVLLHQRLGQPRRYLALRRELARLATARGVSIPIP